MGDASVFGVNFEGSLRLVVDTFGAFTEDFEGSITWVYRRGGGHVRLNLWCRTVQSSTWLFLVTFLLSPVTRSGVGRQFNAVGSTLSINAIRPSSCRYRRPNGNYRGPIIGTWNGSRGYNGTRRADHTDRTNRRWCHRVSNPNGRGRRQIVYRRSPNANYGNFATVGIVGGQTNVTRGNGWAGWGQTSNLAAIGRV